MICIAVAMLMVIASFSVYLFFVFQKRKTRLKENYEKEILKTQIEIRDQAMNDVGRELHDHINQVMTLIKLNMSLLADKGLDAANEKRLSDTKELVKEVINDIRMMSKTLNGDLILHIGFVESIKHELERISRLNICECHFLLEGEEYPVQPNVAFIMFRIVQENLQNILKHSHCKNVTTRLCYTPESIVLTQQDDGVGFDPQKTDNKHGSGRINMQRRADMINARLSFESELSKGTLLTLHVNNGS